jgi:opacity protein-like surface antigen
MKRMILPGASLAAALVATAALAGTASAAEVPENLPFSASTRTFTIKNASGTPTLHRPTANIVCESFGGEGTEVPGKAGEAPHGTFHIAFTKCKEATFNQICTGGDSGDAAGTILTLGTWKLVWDRKNGGSFELTVATVLELTPLTYECSALEKIKLEGRRCA